MVPPLRPRPLGLVLALVFASSLFSPPAAGLIFEGKVLPPKTVSRPANDVPVLAFSVRADAPAQALGVLKLDIAGGLFPAQQIKAAHLYRDLDEDGRVDASDVEVPTDLDYGERTVLLSTQGAALPENSTETFLLTFDFSAWPGVEKTVELTLVEVTALDRSAEATLFFDDVETVKEEWTAQDRWARTTEDAASGVWAWADSPGEDYGNFTDASLTLGPLSIPAATDVQHVLAFSHRYDLEWGPDVASVETSTDNGSHWEELANYTSRSEGWELEFLPLAVAPGSDLLVRFRLRSDGSIVREGWSLDDVGIFALAEQGAPGLAGAVVTLQERMPVLEVETLTTEVSAERGTGEVLAMAVRVTAREYDADLRSLTFAGRGNSTDDLVEAQLYLDKNFNLALDPADTRLGPAFVPEHEDAVYWPPEVIHAAVPDPHDNNIPSQVVGNILNERYVVTGEAGGGNGAEQYNPATEEWVRLPEMLHAHHRHAAAVHKGRLYVVGSQSEPPCEIYDPKTNAWYEMADPPRYDIGFELASGEDSLYLIGEREAYRYFPQIDTWVQLPPPNHGRLFFTAVEVNGKLYALGGVGSPLKVEVYDPVEDEWTVLPDLAARSWSSEAFVRDGVIFLSNGENLQYLDTRLIQSDWVLLPSAAGRDNDNSPFVEWRGYPTLPRSAAVFHEGLNRWFTFQEPVFRNMYKAGVMHGELYMLGSDVNVTNASKLTGRRDFSLPLTRDASRQFLLAVTPKQGFYPRKEILFTLLDAWGLAEGYPDSTRAVVESDEGITKFTLKRSLNDLTIAQRVLPHDPIYDRGRSHAEVMAFSLSSSNFDTQIREIDFRSMGSGDESREVTDVRLWSDEDESGSVTAPDFPVSPREVFLADDGQVCLNLPEDWPALEAGNESSYLLTYDFTGAIGPSVTFQASIETIRERIMGAENETSFITGERDGYLVKLKDALVTPTPTPPVTPTPVVTPSPTANPTVPAGTADLNGDGIVDHRDLLLIPSQWHDVVD